MEKLKIICSFLALLTCHTFFSQIVIGEDPKTSEVKEKQVDSSAIVLPTKVKDGMNTLIFTLNRSKISRKLEPSDNLFSDSLGQRQFETPINTWNMGVGFRTKMTNHLLLNAGINYLQNGEKYLFEQTDTMYSYTSQYRYISMPLALEYVFGEKIQWSVIGGVQPAMFVRFEKSIVSRNTKNVEETKKEVVRSASQEYNSFVLNGFLGIGASVKISEDWSFMMRPEFRFQLNNSYGVNSGYVHKARAFGLTFGMIYWL